MAGEGSASLGLSPPSTATKKGKSPKLVENWFLHRPNQVVKNGSNVGFGPSQMMTPKSGEKVVKKWSRQGLGSKNNQNMTEKKPNYRVAGVSTDI